MGGPFRVGVTSGNDAEEIEEVVEGTFGQLKLHPENEGVDED